MCLSLAPCLVWKIVMSLISQKRTWYYQALRKRTPSVIYCSRNHFFLSLISKAFFPQTLQIYFMQFYSAALRRIIRGQSKLWVYFTAQSWQSVAEFSQCGSQMKLMNGFFQDCFCRLSYVEFICSMGLFLWYRRFRWGDDQRKGNIICCSFQLPAPLQASLSELPRYSEALFQNCRKHRKAQERRN